MVIVYSKDYTNSDYTLNVLRRPRLSCPTIMAIRIEHRIFETDSFDRKFLAKKNAETLKTVVYP